MENLIKLFSKMQYHKQSMTLDITYDKIVDWCIHFVWRDKRIILDSQSCSLTLACADMIQKLTDLCVQSDDNELVDIPFNVLL